MNTKDLMIGDYVRIPLELDRIKQITSTFDLDEALLYEPIKLTDDLLNQLGFKKIDDNRWTFHKEFHLYKSSKGYFVEDHVLIDLIYLHELQHMIKLCKADVTIKL